MKNRSRLTALLLALLMFMSALPVPALADGVITTMDDYQDAMQRLKDALNEPSIPQEQENAYTITRSAQIDAIVRETITGVIAEDGDNTFTLPVAGKLMLSTAEAAEAYQWQISADGVWANIVGDSAAEIALTYAKIQNALSGGAAIVRCALTRGGEVSYSPEAIVAVDMTPKTETTTVEETIPAVSFYAPAAQSQARALNADVLANEDQETYSIVINYVFENGDSAANSYTARIAKGSDFKQTVTSPAVLGYTPDKEQVAFNITDIQADVTETVMYRPAEVEFTVKHYQQNVSNDDYTLVDTETKKKYTKSEVGEGLAKTDYAGFYSLLYDTTTAVAADGSTVVEIYYDRYYYLMNFNLDGGYGVEPIYARFGAPISVDTPTKPGYTFDGWDKMIPATMPADNTSYKASWTVDGQAKVTVVVWGENADDENYSYIKSSEILATPGEKLTLSGLQGKLICGKEAHKHSNSCGVDCKHAHDLTCYGLSANASSTNPNDNTASWCNSKPETYFEQLGLEDGYLYYDKEDAMFDSKNIYYLRFGGKYYKLTKNQFNKLKGKEVGSTSDNSRNYPDYYYKYSIKASGISCTHTHDDSCYTCGKTVHSHTSACYYNTSFMEKPNLWELVRSDEVTVAADGITIMNVYYDRVEFTLHFRRAYSDSDDYGTIKAKWGANIREAFKQKCNDAGTSNWSATSNAEGPWTSYLDIMPTEDRTYYANKDGYGTSTAYYYVEGLDGKDTLFYENKSTGSGYTVTVEEFIEISGFTFDAKRSAKVGDSFNGAKFYYTRNSYNLKFYNHNGEIEGSSKTVKYEAPLSGYNFTPDYPAGLEPNAYVFDGWYTTAGCYEGSKADLNTMTMPASNVILYAKWVPKTHTVKTYLTKVEMDEGKAPTNTWTAVPHGTAVTNPPKDPVNGQYTFVGWFYISDTGEEKAFDFSMPVNRDLNLYAKWSSNTLVKYTIKYTLEDSTEIAPPTKGSALAATTKTFDAKTGNELNESYRTGYFPKTSSHSLTMNIEGGNEFTFIYVPKEEVNYTVRYLEKDTNAVLREEKHAATSNAVITEKFEQITGYAPDAYQKRLVLSADEANNVITFWYVKDDKHAPVQIIHWTQNIAGNGYTEYQSSTDLNGVINQEYSEESLNIPGFTYNKSESNAKGTLTAEGLVLNLYYDRNEYPYEFRFLEQGTENELAGPEKGTARYQAQVTQTAKTIPGYTLVSAENQAINIAIEDGTAAVKNVKIFYYTEQTVDIKYEVVGPTGCGTLDNYQEAQLKVITGTVNGSTPTAAEGFKFVGWYKDQPCTQPVDASWVANNNKLTPGKTKNYGTETTPAMGYEAATYYAKFESNLTTLTITKSGAAVEADGTGLDAGQSFLFKVTGAGLPTDGLLIAINGNDSETISGLTVGQEYTVTEETDWSWRYTPTNNGQKITLAANGNNEVKINNRRDEDQWLDGDCYEENNFGAVSPKTN